MSVRELAEAARRAGKRVAALDPAARRRLLESLASSLLEPAVQEQILAANREDVRAGEVACDHGKLEPALVKRLILDTAKLQSLADGIRQIAAMKDVLGLRTVHRELDKGLILERVSCPLGLLGVVFESRPDAVPQITTLALKSGNAVLLKGGKEARLSNGALVKVIHDVLREQGLPEQAVGLLEDRADVAAMLRLDDLMDLIVARGSGAFVRYIKENTSIAVLGHSEGLCHLFVHHTATPPMAARLAVDGKCSYPAACNAIETLLWEDGSEAALAEVVQALRLQNVELRGCQHTRALHPGLSAATDEDWATEYGTLILSIRRVPDLDAALAHIETHGSQHTEVIVAEERDAADRFIAEVDAANVFHNASSRFADGYRYGLGAEVGISTGKLHARGPVGLEGLVTYRWLMRGGGQIASDYGPGKKSFLHRDR